VTEVAAFTALAALAVPPATRGQRAGQATPGSALLARLQAGIPGAEPAVAGISILALVVFGISVARAGSPALARAPASSSLTTALKTAKIGGVIVLTNVGGFTLYWFAPDTAARSACYGTCAGYWPPVTGTPSAGPGITGKLGTPDGWTVEVVELDAGGRLRIRHHGFQVADVANADDLARWIPAAELAQLERDTLIPAA
jgi:Secreted repeat of unknown function